MGKKNNRNAFRGIVILLFLILLCLAGNVYLHRNLEQERTQVRELEKERQVFEERKEQAAADQKELQEELEKTREALDSQERGHTLDAGGSGEQDENSVSVPAGIEPVRERILAVISERMNSGENWQVSVRRLSDHAEEAVGSGQMTAASLIKLYIMGAVYEDYDALTGRNGKDYIDALLRGMITVSDNNAANALTELLGQGDAAAGRAAVSDYCARNGYADSSMGRMLLETGTDSENYTSAKDCTVFLERVYNKEIPCAEEMMNLLKQQERVEKIPAGIPDGVTVANKTGELDRVENDAAVVLMENSPYILCVMSENLGDTASARQAIVSISSEVYNYIMGQE